MDQKTQYLTQYLIVLRHGETHPNVLAQQPTDKLHYEVTGSDQEIGLTSRGLAQIRETCVLFLVPFLREARIQISRIDCSQFKRTREAAQILQETLPNKPPIVQDPRVAKRNYGEFWNITYRGVAELFPEEYDLFRTLGGFQYRPPGGENYLDLRNRLLEFR